MLGTMKLFIIFNLLIFSAWAKHPGPTESPYKALLQHTKLEISKSDVIVAEHITNTLKLINKGAINQDLLGKVIKTVGDSKHFQNFVPFLKSIKSTSKLSAAPELIAACRDYSKSKEIQPLEKRLERIAGNFCREKTLEAIGKEIEKNNSISDESTAFIQDNLKFYLTKKNKKNFAYFLQAQSSRPEILKKISQFVTTYSVAHDIVPSQEVLKDIELNEQITKLIQTKGFNPLQHQNVFYAEYGKMIEQGYKVIDNKNGKQPDEKKAKELFVFMKNYLELNQDHLPIGLCYSRLNDFSKAIFRAGFTDLSRDIFKFIVKKNNKEVLQDALFFYLWTYILNNELKTALKIADQHDLLDDDYEAADPRLKFWIGHIFEKLDDQNEAISIYENLVLNNPLNYYSIMATKRLQSIKPDSVAVKFYKSSVAELAVTPLFDPKDLEEDHLSSLVRLRAWAKIGNQKLLNLELRRLGNHTIPAMLVKYPTEKQLNIKSDLHLINALIIQESSHLASFRYLYNVIDKKEVLFNRSLLEILYPKPFFEDLSRVLKNDDLDPIVVLALIRQESVFNPAARSPVGARGLMQLMPTTARRIRKGVTEKQLANPKINIEVGTKYFKGLLKRYDGNLVFVLSAYNAGENRVERWRNMYWNDEESIVRNIEQIPFLETRNYVKLIFRNIFFYKLLHEKNELADPGELNKIYDVSLGFKH
jgi:soluble lytic murein transglycosylase